MGRKAVQETSDFDMCIADQAKAEGDGAGGEGIVAYHAPNLYHCCLHVDSPVARVDSGHKRNVQLCCDKVHVL